MLRRWCWGSRGGGSAGWRVAVAALALLVTAAVRVPLRAELAGRVPRAQPHELAAHIADFNNLRAFYPHIGSWRVEEQWSNYTSWRYAARFACGVRCAGRAAVTAHDLYAHGAGAQHGRTARSHRVGLLLTTCWHLPLLPWPSFCDEVSVESMVSDDGVGGARLHTAGTARAALGAALAGRGAALRGDLQDQLRILQDTFA